MNIIVPLERYVAAIIGCRQYAVIDVIDAELIRGTDESYKSVCIVENSNNAIDAQCRPLPVLANGLFRLWYRKDWELNDNRRREIHARLDALDNERKARRQQVIDSFVAKGIAVSIATTIVGNMTDETITTTLASL